MPHSSVRVPHDHSCQYSQGSATIIHASVKMIISNDERKLRGSEEFNFAELEKVVGGQHKGMKESTWGRCS